MECRGETGGIPFVFDRRNKSSQLWVGAHKWGQVTLIIPKFKVFPAHLSQTGCDASGPTANDSDLNVPQKPERYLAQASDCSSHFNGYLDEE